MVLAWIVLFLSLPSPLMAGHLDEKYDFDGGFFRTQTITGDWNGARTRLWERGWVPEIEYFGDVLYSPAGDARREGEYAGYLELDLHVDLDRAMGLRDTRILLSMIATHGTNPSRSLGTAQTVSALEAGDTAQLFQAWVETFAFHRRLSFKIGLYSLDTEFDYKETANLFVNGVFGTGVDLSETGVNGPAIFPNSAVGARLGLKLKPGWYAQAAVLDGVPGIPGDTTGTRIRLNGDDGLQVAMETGYEKATPGGFLNKAGVGALVYTTAVPNRAVVRPAGNAVTHHGTFTLYGFIDWLVWQESGDPAQGLKGLFRAGLADEDTARFDYDITAALMYTGLFPGREADRTGLGLSFAHNADGFKAARRNAGQPVDDVELVLEATHSLMVLPGVHLQPTLQYFINPGSSANLDDTLYLGLHLGLIF